MQTFQSLCFRLMAIMSIGFSACQSAPESNNSASPKTLLANAPSDVTKQFCGVPPDIMVALIKNYKEQVWSKTSDTAAGKFDARFMEISIDQLENFIAYAKQNAQKDGLKVASIRMYYINYPGDKKNEEYLVSHKTGNVFEDYSGCHSIAMVPVVGLNINDPARRDYYEAGKLPAANINSNDFTANGNLIFVPDNCGPNSTMENHNELCPPLKGCSNATLLKVADELN